MYKDCFDVNEDIGSLLNVPELTQTIDGKIWPVVKPSGRTQKDIVVQVLFCDNEHIQTSIVNINIHVPNIENLPNQAELERLSELVTSLVHDKHKGSFWTEVTIPGELFDNPDGSYFSRVKVEYHSIQLNFKNI